MRQRRHGYLSWWLSRELDGDSSFLFASSSSSSGSSISTEDKTEELQWQVDRDEEIAVQAGSARREEEPAHALAS